VASHFGYIKINWPKVNRHLEKVEREISEYDPSYLKNSVCFWVKFGVIVQGTWKKTYFDDYWSFSAWPNI